MRLCLTPPVFTAVKNRWRLRALATLVAALAAVVVTARRADAHWCDSGGALTFVEQMICGDQNLIGQDHELNRLYKRLGGRKNISLKTEQREWLRSRNACADPDCLRWHYDERLRVLRAMRNGAGAGVPEPPPPESLALTNGASLRFVTQASVGTWEAAAARSKQVASQTGLNCANIIPM